MTSAFRLATGAAGPIPSGEVIPSGGVTAPMPTCANAAPTSHNVQTIAATKMPFMDPSTP